MRLKSKLVAVVAGWSVTLFTETLYAQNKHLDSANCIETMAAYQRFWTADSLGKSGLRLILGQEVLAKCNLIGIKWNVLSHLLGKPNYTSEEREYTYYRYFLFCFRDGCGGNRKQFAPY